MRTAAAIFLGIWLAAVGLLADSNDSAEITNDVVLAMCQPTIKQIKNIEELYEKDLIFLNRIILLGIYHENEETDYQEAKEYVKSNGLDWVKFRAIKDLAGIADVFKENLWTSQFKDIFDHSDGIIFTGGEDIPPRMYGQETLLLTDPRTPLRSFYEISFLFHLLGGSQNPDFKPFLEERPNYPILAICLGMQSMNVACGGTLIQDIPSQVYGLKTAEEVLRMGSDHIHSAAYIISNLDPAETDFAPALHRIRLKRESVFVNDMGMKFDDTPWVLTSHHQAIDRVAKNLVVVATSMDGRIVEAVQHRRFSKALGVQFHPEYYKLYKKGWWGLSHSNRQPLNLRLFLESHPPSFPFHQSLWRWFSAALQP